MSDNNRVGVKIEGSKLELETNIKKKIDDIKTGHMKSIEYLDMKILCSTSINTS